MKKLLMLVAMAVSAIVLGDELFVDRSGGDGAYTSINAAIRAANAGDTIWVRPGTYDNDPAMNPKTEDVPAVVYVTKPLTILATSANPADTLIVGHRDAESVAGGDTLGAGANALRCVRFASEASSAENPAVMKGFTICNGGCYTKSTAEDTDAGHPGGVAGESGQAASFYVVDCVISNCVGVRGGLVRRGNYVRCRFSDGHAYSAQSLGRNLALLNCLVTHMKGSGVVLDGPGIVNTTFADMEAVPYYQSGSLVKLYNCVLTACGENRFTTPATGEAVNSLLPYPEMALQKTGCIDQVTDNLPYPLIAPLVGDFHLRDGTSACGIGLAEHIAAVFPDAPDIVEIYRDLDGKPIPTSGPVNPGCYQETVEARTAALQMGTDKDWAAKTVCDGYVADKRCLYAFGRDPLQTFRFTAQPGEVAFAYQVGDLYRYPDMDESIRLMAPPIGTDGIAFNLILATQEFWVDPTNGVDGAGYGTSERPFRTLQYACDNAVAGNRQTLVHAAPGVYDEGGKEVNHHTNRVAIVGARHVRIKGAGRGRSFIVGKADTTSEGASNGMGPAAVRCVLIDKNTRGCVQGFTLQDGYADYTPDNTDTDRYGGGLFYGGETADSARQLADCTLNRGMAFRGAITYGGVVVRCEVWGCNGQWGGSSRACQFESCVFRDNLYSPGNAPNQNDVKFWGCTLVGSTMPVLLSQAALSLKNCIVYVETKPTGVATLNNVENTIVWGCGTVSGSSTLLSVDPKFADYASRDFRLRTDSPAFTAGFVPLADSWKHTLTDFNGNPIRFAGSVIPGAFQGAVDVVTVDSKDGSFNFTGTRVVKPGESVTVTVEPIATRNFLGLSANDELQEGQTSYTFVAPVSPFGPDGTVRQPVLVKAVYSTNWYVNADAAVGSDDNTGFDPEHPWKTLAKLQRMKSSFRAGDVIHAARGDYNEDKVIFSVPYAPVKAVPDFYSRCEVPEGVTLLADEGPSVTFITGKPHSDSSKNGPDAIRCVAVANGARIEGFTLRDGHTRAWDDYANEGDQYMGGGFFAFPIDKAANCGVAYNCVIRDCSACRGGAVFGGRALNCRIFSCKADACSSGIYYGYAVGCCFDHFASGYQICRLAYYLSHCTFGPDIDTSKNGNIMNELIQGADNTAVLCKMSALSSAAKMYTNCRFLKMDGGVNRLGMDGCRELDAVEDFMIGEDYVPLKDSPLVDKSNSTSLSWLEGRDCAMSQRTYNDAADIGCCEYDWRGVYSSDIGAKVTKADPHVVESGGKVLIKGGALEFAFPKTSTVQKTRYTIPFEVTGSGDLAVCRNGEEMGTYVAAGETALTFKSADAENVMTFVYTPGTDDTGGGLIGATTVRCPGFILSIR